MDSRDLALQSVTPTVMVPRFGEFEPLSQPGQRVLMAANGVWLEVYRPWLYVRMQLSDPLAVAVPYGEVEPCLALNCGPVPLDLLQQFTQQAREVCPLEHAAWVVWDETSRRFMLQQLGVRDASGAHIHFERPSLAPAHHMVIDLHSHGCFAAGFSPTDDLDDRGEVKIAMVVGHCDRDRVSTALRLCVNGLFIDLTPETAGEGVLTFKEAA